VATVGVNGAANAGILAAQMIALEDADLAEKLERFKEDMAEGVRKKDEKVREMF
jgi:5-(carboxyamino)imidazole ribonucleotide mutase